LVRCENIYMIPYNTTHTTSWHLIDCNRLQQTATDCNTLQYTATDCNRLLHIRHRDTLHTAVDCNRLQHTATDCNWLQHTRHRDTLHTATDCNRLQQTATDCNRLQQTAIHCNTLQHIRHRYTLHTPVLYPPVPRCLLSRQLACAHYSPVVLPWSVQQSFVYVTYINKPCTLSMEIFVCLYSCMNVFMYLCVYCRREVCSSPLYAWHI